VGEVFVKVVSMSSQHGVDRPKIGINVLVLKDGKALLGKRIGSGVLATGMYQTPAGHLELLEPILACAHREILEETGIEIQNLRFLNITNVRKFAPAHYVCLSFVADWKSGEPVNKEPDRCEGWDWYPLTNLPEPRTPASEAAIRGYLDGGTLFESTVDGFEKCLS
jgi:8-oxo-dGTP diphosphatase